MRVASGFQLTELVDAIRAMQGATHRVDEAARQGLHVNATDMQLLGNLHAHGPLSPTTLANALSITQASTTVAVDRLSTRGLVTRATDPRDKRRSIIALTPACQSWLGSAYGPLRTDGPAVLAQFTAKELATIARFIAASTTLQTDRADAIARLPLIDSQEVHASRRTQGAPLK